MKKIIITCLFLNIFLFTRTEAQEHIYIASFFFTESEAAEAEEEIETPEEKKCDRWAPSPCFEHYEKGRLFIFDPRKHKWFACEDGELVCSGVASGGKEKICSDIGRGCRTPTSREHGKDFKVSRKEGADYRSSIYPIDADEDHKAPMPYAMFFDDRGYAIHAAPKHQKSWDSNQSHGCIRVPLQDAIWLHRHFIDNNSRVRILEY